MAVFETWLKSDLKKPVVVQKLAGNLFSADNGGNKIGVEIFDDGASASVTGGVTGYIIRDDNATVVVTGTLSGNKASIILPQSAYTVVGNISIVIKVGTTTVGACVGYVYRTTTDTMVDPGHVIPSIEELLAKIAACEQATTNANAATTSANNAATNANEKASLADEKAILANNAATSATTAAGNANTAAGSANTAASAANTAATKIDDMTVSASGLPAGSTPTATISEVSGHKHIAFGLVKGDKGDKGDPGKDFHIQKTFVSIAAMQAYDPDEDQSPHKVHENEFVMIDTGSVQDADTGKLYCYEPETQDRWRYIGDLSGAQGIKGETGTGIDSIALNQDYTLTIYLDDGTSHTTASIRGAKGDKGDTGFAPTIAISTITGGHRVTVTDSQGTNSFDVMDGTNAYVYIRYAANQPTADSDMKTTPDEWIGIYSGASATAPTTYTDYTWYKIKGETGTAENVYGSTIPMSPQDSTKIATAINGKVDANQGAGNAGKALGIDNTGAVVPVLFSGEDFTGATASTAGESGLVPAPSAGDQGKSLFGDGTWKQVADPAEVSANSEAIANLQSYKMPSYLSAGDQPSDLNSFLHGLCYVGTNTLNRPEDYCIITAYQVANYVCQIGHGVTSSNMYYRQGRSDGTNWTAWKGLVTKSDINPIEITITRHKTPTRADVLKCYKSGYVCTLAFNNVSYGESFSTDTVIATLYAIRPQSLTRFVLYDGNKNPYLCYIDAYGNVSINGYTSGALLYGAITFIATT